MRFELVLPDVLLDQLLAGVGAHVLVVARDRHVGRLATYSATAWTVHHGRDVGAAVADVDADARTEPLGR